MNKEIEDAIEHLTLFKEDLKELEANEDFILQDGMKIDTLQSLEIVLNYIKDSTPNSVIRELISTKFKAVFEGNTEIADDATIMNIVKYVKVEDIEEILKEGEK